MSDMHDTRRREGGGLDPKPAPLAQQSSADLDARDQHRPVPSASTTKWDEEDRRKLWRRTTNLASELKRVKTSAVVSAIVMVAALLFFTWRQHSVLEERMNTERDATTEELKKVHDALFRLSVADEEELAKARKVDIGTNQPTAYSANSTLVSVHVEEVMGQVRAAARKTANGFDGYCAICNHRGATIGRCFDEYRVVELRHGDGRRCYQHFDGVAYPIVAQMRVWSLDGFRAAGEVARALREGRGRNLAMDLNAVAAAAKAPLSLRELRQYDGEAIEAANDDLRVVVVQHLPYAYGNRIRLPLHLSDEHYVIVRNRSVFSVRKLEHANSNAK